jgi:3-phosphoshikimate 1-carboxyvinyltransferase
MHKGNALALRATGARALTGRIRVPGDKSVSHRALIFGAMASGRTRVSGLLESADVMATAQVLRELGARIERDGAGWLVTGCGTGGFGEPVNPLDFGNSGTSVRLMMGAIAGHDIRAHLIGDASLSKRPMGRVLTPLQQMGLEITGASKDKLPLDIRGSDGLVPIRYELPVASAQVKSAILIAGLLASGATTVIEPKPTRDHTERMLAAFGAQLSVRPLDGGGREITVRGPAELTGCDVIVPGDPSSAAFPAAAALIVPGSDITIENILVNDTRTGFYTTLREMGADIAFLDERDAAGERVADIRVRHGAPLRGVTVPAARAPSMIDEYPMLAALAAFASGETRMEGLEELRVKESDRLEATRAGLAAAGVAARIEGDSLIVSGQGGAKVRGGGRVETHLDHRIAMAFLTLGLHAEQGMAVDDTTMIDTSFPGFVALMEQLGAQYEQEAA